MTDKSADLPKPDPSEPNTEQIDSLRRLYRDEASTTDGPTTPSASVPRMIGNYKLLENIGEGGMGSVWVTAT